MIIKFYDINYNEILLPDGLRYVINLWRGVSLSLSPFFYTYKDTTRRAFFFESCLAGILWTLEALRKNYNGARALKESERKSPKTSITFLCCELLFFFSFFLVREKRLHFKTKKRTESSWKKGVIEYAFPSLLIITSVIRSSTLARIGGGAASAAVRQRLAIIGLETWCG